jgi:acyl-CoA synthetase (NDP forming)
MLDFRLRKQRTAWDPTADEEEMVVLRDGRFQQKAKARDSSTNSILVSDEVRKSIYTIETINI